MTEDARLDANALLAGQRAAMLSNDCGCTVTETGERVFCDDARLGEDRHPGKCSCRIDAEAAISAYLASLSLTKD